MQVEGLDHIVLTVTDIDITCEFYERTLGMRAISFENGRRALRFGDQKINLHAAGHEFEPKAEKPIVGSGDLCFYTHEPVEQFASHIRALGVEVFQGPVERSGAVGRLRSIYLRDPDGNLIEVSNRLA